MTKYSTLLEFNNLKNSLKSGGSRIVAIDNLTQEFKCLHALLGGTRAPVVAFGLGIIERSDLENGAIQPGGVDIVHRPILSLTNVSADSGYVA